MLTRPGRCASQNDPALNILNAGSLPAVNLSRPASRDGAELGI